MPLPVHRPGFTRRTFLASLGWASSALVLGAQYPQSSTSGVPLHRRELYSALTESAYAHPGLLHTASDLADASGRLATAAQPWLSGFEQLTANARASSTWVPRPVASVIRGGTGQNYMQMVYDIHAAYQNGLRWRVSGVEAHGAKAVEILNAWSATLTSVSGNADRFLAAGIYGYQFANAAELVRERSDFQLAPFRDMLLNIFRPMNEDFLANHNGAVITNYWANWDLCNMASLLAIGIFTDRDDLVDQAITYFQQGAGNGSILHAIPYVYEDEGLAQWQESGRDQGHTIMGVGLMGAFCEMAWNQGIDCWGAHDNRLLKAAQYVAKYNLGYDVPFTSYTWQSGPSSTAPHVGWQTQTVPGDVGRGQERPVWELILGHYKGRRGLSADWIEQMVNAVRPEGGGDGTTSGGYDQLGLGTLTAAASEVGTRVSRLQALTHPNRYISGTSATVSLAAAPSLASSRFRVVPGLASTAGGRMSFESMLSPGTYLRHSGYRTVLAAPDSSATFADDATFLPVDGLGHSMMTSLRSHNFPTRYLRHRDFELWIDPVTTDGDKKDATFRLVD